MEDFLRQAGSHVEPEGLIAMEFGMGQEATLRQLVQDLKLGDPELLKDDAGVTRNLLVRCP